MKDITLEKFSANTPNALSTVLLSGDILRVTTDKGNAVIMEEAEYTILRDAMKMLLGQQ